MIARKIRSDLVSRRFGVRDDGLSLRNLGYVRTLVMVDGLRTVSESTGSSAVDIGSIPITLINDIQVSTGGDSAIYGADGVDYTPLASKQLDGYEKNGFGNLPVCVAKTQYSLSADANLKGAPTGFRLPVREVRASVGAGFIYPICGNMNTLPGLASKPAAISIDLDENGEIVGLY